MTRFLRKLSLLIGRGRFQSELADEMRFHHEQLEQELMAGGMSPEAARFAAARQFGNTTRINERSHEVVGFSVESVLHDVRYSARQLCSSPAFTVVMLLTLALSIGANSAIFSVIDGVLLKTLPYPQPER